MTLIGFKRLFLCFQVHKNVLDVSFHVTQYQNIIADLKGEIDRLKDKINNEAVIAKMIIPKKQN